MGSISIRRNRFRKSLIVAALAIIGIAVFLISVESGREEITTFDPQLWQVDETKVERGKYLAKAGNCASCHTAPGGVFMAGGLAFNTPFGTIHSTNITPDPDTGIGSWSGEEFLVSMRRGLRPNGEHLYPVFPYTAFTKITDEDIAALYVYLQSIPPANTGEIQNDIAFPFNQRMLMTIWNAFFFNDGVYQPDSSQSPEWNRGAYIVEALAHCSACHSPRNLLGAEDSKQRYAGGEYTDRVRDGTLHPWFAPNLTSAPMGLGMWPQEEIAAYLNSGQNAFVDTFGPMNEVILNSTRFLNDADVNAMAAYLKTLAASNVEPRQPASKNAMGMGRTVYNLHCGTCHLPTGLGDEEQAPRLAGGSLVVQARNPASLINVILYGPELPDPPLPTKRRKPMEEFQYLLTDDEVAALASYVRSSWGNVGGAVTAEQVSRQR